MPTAVELLQVQGTAFNSNLFMGVVADLPVINTFDAREVTSDKILSLGIVALPTGRFLNLGEGYRTAQTDTALVEYNASRIGGSVKIQISTEEKWNKANRSAIGAGIASDYATIQIRGATLGQMRTVQTQIFYGTTNDAKGFPGLKGLTPYVASNVLATTDHAQDSSWAKSVINAGGSTSSTASSIYAVRFGEMDCQMCIGGPGGLSGFLNYPTPEKVWLEATDAVDSVSKGDWYHVTTAEGYLGLSVMGSNQANASRQFPQYSVRRIANVTAQTGYTCTDSLLAKLTAAAPDEKRASIIYMSYRSRRQLQESRSPSSTIYVGGVLPKNSAFNYAPLPEQFEGIPIVATDAIGNTDAIES